MSSPNWWGDWRPTLTPHTGNLLATDLIECTMIVGGLPVNTVITGAQILGAVPTPSVAWGSITGTLSSQTDLNTALSGKASTGAVTGTGITMSTARILGRSTAGAGAIEEITIGSGLTLSAGTLTASGGGLTVGTTAIASGTIGRVLFQGTGNVLQQSANLFWDNTNSRLGIGTASPSQTLHIVGTFRASGGVQTGAIYGSGTNFNLASDAYIQCTSTTGKNAGLTVNRFSTSEYASVDLITNASFVSGWSIQMVPSQTRLNIVDRNPSDNVRMCFHNGGNIGIGTTTNAGYKLDVNGSSRFLDKVSIGSPTAASAVLEISSTIQGFLPPRMTNAQMLAIATPAAGLVVYDTTNNKHCGYNGTAWQNFY